MSNNEKIANWMGLSKMPDGTWLDFIGNGEEGQLYSELLFDTSWDWIMSVVEKVENMKDSNEAYLFSVEMGKDFCAITRNEITRSIICAHSEHGNKILSVNRCIVKFIDFLETQKP